MTIQDHAHDPRISKPHPHKKGYRCEIKTASGTWRHGPTAPAKEEAEVLARQVLAVVEREHGQTVASCIDAYLDHRRNKGSRDQTIVTYRLIEKK